MDTRNDDITKETLHKENWEQPELTKLDINKTESGINVGAEFLILDS